MGLLKATGIIQPKNKPIDYDTYQRLRRSMKLIALHNYLTDVTNLDTIFENNCSVELLKLYGISINNQFLITSSYSTLQKMLYKFKKQLLNYTKNNIINFISKTINWVINTSPDDILTKQVINTIKNKRIINSSYFKEDLEQINNTLYSLLLDINYLKTYDLNKTVSIVKSLSNLINLIDNYQKGNTSLFDIIVLNTKNFIYSYIVRCLQSNRIESDAKFQDINLLDYFHNGFRLEDVIKNFLIGRSDDNNQKLITMANEILSIGNYNKLIMWNIINEKILEFASLFSNDKLTYNDPETKLMLESILIIMFL